MRIFTSILLLTLIFLQTFSRFVIEADYFLNKSYIAKVLCLNKERPKMHCNGKCYLARRLKEDEKQDQKTPATRKQVIDIQLFHPSKTIELYVFRQPGSANYLPQFIPQLSSVSNSVFHPPSV